MKTVNKIASLKEVGVETATNVETFYSNAGIVKAKLNAPLLKRFNNSAPYTELAKGLSLVFYDEHMQENGRMTARYGINYEQEQKMIVRNNVVVVNVKGEILNTEELTWNQATRKIFTDKFVKITTADEVLYGDGMEADEDFTHYKIRKIKGTIKVKENL